MRLKFEEKKTNIYGRLMKEALSIVRVVVLESRFGLESGLEFIFARLGLELYLKGLGLGL